MTANSNIPDLLQLAVFSIERVKDWICWLGPQGQIYYANQESCRALGYTKEEVAQLTIFDVDLFYTPESWAQHFAALKVVGSRTFETRHRKKDGSTIAVEINANYIEFNGQEYNCAIVREITERKRAEQSERTKNRILEMVANNSPLYDILNDLAMSVEQDDPAKLCSILLVDESGQQLGNYVAPSLPVDYSAAIEGLPIGPDIGSCGTAAYLGEKVIVADIQTDPLWRNFKQLAAEFALAACWSMPIKNDAGAVVGTFAIYHRETKAPSEADIAQLAYLANLAKIAMQRDSATEELKLSDSVFKNSSEAMLVTDAGNRIIAANPAYTEITGYRLEEVAGRHPREFSSGRHDETLHQEIADALAEKGCWRGEVWELKKSGEEYVKWASINTIYDQAGQPFRRVILFSDITEKKKNEELIWFEANYDALTHLPNRRLFREKLKQELLRANRLDKKVALLFLDLDRFKEVNDASGHEGGDLLLVEVARRLKQALRGTDGIARIGGDEFTITLPEVENMAAVSTVAGNIVRLLAAPFAIENQMHYVSASIGITLYPDDAQHVDLLIKNADQAMYAAKSQGRNRYYYFTPAMQEAAVARLRTTSDLRTALAQNQFVVHYQPIVELASGRIRKAEALVRWQHPLRGLVPPGEFIPIAEDTGLIIELGNTVFRQATAMTVQWRKAHPAFQISINKSPVQFRSRLSQHADWCDYLASIALPAQAVVLEITEGLLFGADTAETERLAMFSEAGMQIAIDDFGTGYSSLAYIKKFDIDYVKIDQSFTRNLHVDSDQLALCEAIIVMSHKLGIKVVAEGVETAEQRDLLLQAGCDYAQGYFFSQPVPPEEFSRLLALEP